MRTHNLKATFQAAARVMGLLLFGAVASFAQQTINLSAGPSNAVLPDGSSVPMWGYTCGTAATGATATCAPLNPAAALTPGLWSPVVITVPVATSGATSLTINLTNNLSFTPTTTGATVNHIPTSLTIVGQIGGGLGNVAQRTTAASPTHDSQIVTWATVGSSTAFTPPPQGARVQSFSTEVAAGATTALTWSALQPGTYLIESGTHPSIQGPMGLYGILVVTTAPKGSPTETAAGTAYPVNNAIGTTAITYDAEVPMVFGEIDPVQNKAVTTAVNTNGFSETSTYQQAFVGGSPIQSINVTNGGAGYTSAPNVTITPNNGASATATVSGGAVVSITVNSVGTGFTYTPTITISGGGGTGATAAAVGTMTNALAQCQGAAACYPPAVNYTPLYYLINGVAFDKTHVAASLFPTTPNATMTTGTTNILVRMVNAGLRMHVPAIVGTLTTQQVSGTPATNGPSVPGFSLIAEDGNVLPGLHRIQTDVLMVPGKVMDVMINAPKACTTACTPIAVYDRELSLSSNAINRDAGMLAYIGVNGTTTPADPGLIPAVARADNYPSLLAGQTFTVSDVSKGVIANDTNVYGVHLLTPPANGTVTLNSNGTFTYVPKGTAVADTFTYCANGTVTGTTCSSGLTATVTLGAATVENASGISAYARAYTATTGPTASSNATLAIKSPGVLGTAYDISGNPADVDGAGYPLSVVTSSTPIALACTGGSGTVVQDSEGGFAASVSGTGAVSCSFSYQAKNSQGTASAAQTVTLNFPAASNLSVTVLDGYDKKTTISDYRWIIEEDKTFYTNPNCLTNPLPAGCPSTTNTNGVVPLLGVNFHTSYMPYIAQGCTGPLSCEGGQTVLDNNPTSKTFGQHIAAVCDMGDGVCRLDSTGNGFTAVFPSSVHLDPTKRYYISVLPGDAANPFTAAYTGTPDCTTPGHCGHGMGGTAIAAGQTSVTILTQPSPYPPAKLSVFVFEDDFPLNGEMDGGGGTGSLTSVNEPGLGGFQIHLWDAMGGNGDFTGQMTYDMFNQPLTNGLAGQIDPSDGLDACPMSNTLESSRTGTLAGTSTLDPTQNGITGMIVTCPLYESDGKTPSPLAGQAVIENLMPGRWGVVASPGADRIARGEEWLQTNTLDGQKAHDAFTKISEPAYFQEFGPAGYHVAIGFANPAIINSRHQGVCAGTDPNFSQVGAQNCNNTITGRVVGERLSRTPDERLYGSGSHDAFYWTQCYVSFGDPDGEDFAFTKCNADGTFTLSNLPDGDWRVTTFDQWNDQLVDGLSTPVRLSAGGTASVTNMGDIASTQWQTNLYTKTFINDDKNGISPGPSSAGIPFANVAVRLRDGSLENLLVTDFTGTANFNESFPLFAWYVVETDVTRYKNTGTHVVYDVGGPADGTLSTCGGTASGTGFPPCGQSVIGKYLANTVEQVSVPTNLRIPGAVYCKDADCSTHTAAATNGIQAAGVGSNTSDPPSACTTGTTGATTCTTELSSGRIDPPWYGVEGWQGFPGQNNFLEFGKEPYVAGENGGIKGHVIYASTRPFDDPQQLVQTQWEPLVPHVTINLYQESFGSDGITPTLKLVDTTQTSSWDDWAQGFRADGTPNMNCPGQGNSTAGTAIPDLFFFSLFNQPDYLDVYNNAHSGTALHTLPNNSQFKCYDGMHNWNQLQPAPYDGMYQFPSVTARDTNGKPTGTNCTICGADPVPSPDLYAGIPMLPVGKYVVEVVLPPGYELVKEEDKNILIGDNFIAPVTQQFGGLGNIFIIPDQASVASSQQYPGPGNNANNAQNPTQSLGTSEENGIVPGFIPEPIWPCVGEARVVPDYISLYPQTHQVAPFAGATRNLCDRKEVTLSDQAGAIAKFYIYTSTHIASKFTGGITDDYTSEFDPFSPQFGEKFAPPDLPISIKDWAGNETSRVYADHWGAYDGMTYSTWEVNPPNPTGYSPTMMVVCMNDPGPIPSANGTMVTDPLFTQGYSQFCYELPFMPGTTQYLDTPVVPTSAFAGAGYNNVDCYYPDQTPAIAEVDGDKGLGPWIPLDGGSHTLTITALGDQLVPNYAYTGPAANVAPYNQKNITRHYGFGSQTGSKVTIGGKSVTITSWSDTKITVSVSTSSQNLNIPLCAVQQQPQYHGSTARCGELVITRGDNGRQSIDAVTITIGGKAPSHVPASGSIQAAIDSADPGDMIIIDPTCTTTATGATITCPAPGTAGTTFTTAAHNEMLIMWKPVRLQGVGAATSIINANSQPAGKIDVWREYVNCLFGLSLSGTPTSSGPIGTAPPNQFDSTGQVSCPVTGGWTHFNQFDESTGNNPQVDRLPLEAVIGWSAELNGNLAELLQEPSLMGALEGAAVTVLAKGVNFPSDPYASSLLMGFPTGTTLLQGPTAECFTTNAATGLPTTTELVPNPFPSNFSCNPSSIDGIGLTDGSQGGGAVFVHGWGHNLQIANDRIYNNSGTLSGGINVGQGEYPPAYIQASTTNAAPGSCLNDPTLPAGTVLPYCQNVNVNVHNNYISLNSSTGDELFSATPAGAGGVSFCTGSDYYQFNYNWVCGNLSSGDGGGLGHMGFSYNGDIEHNTIVFNQSLNPTIPANGGGIVVMGTPDADIVCPGPGQALGLDQDCPPPSGAGNIVAAGIGPSDGAGPNLLINANLIMGNSAEAGTGGGIAFQAVNGSDVVAFPSTPENWNTVTLTNNIIADNIAGWDGGGISLADSLDVDVINNTIASNTSTATAGILFTTLGAPLASSSGTNCMTTSTTSCPEVGGLVAIQNGAVLTDNIRTLSVVCPTGHPNCTSVSYPKLENDIFWQNSTYFIGVGAQSAQFQQSVVSLYNSFGGQTSSNLAPTQSTTGQCIAPTSYWDIGVRGDTGPHDHSSTVTLNPMSSVLTDITGYPGAPYETNKASNPGFISQYCDGSRTPPEAATAMPGAVAVGWSVPAGVSDATVPNPIFNLTPVATVDEGNNWINLRWGPLTMTNPTVKGADGNYGGGAMLGNYGLQASSSVNGLVDCNTQDYADAPAFDFYGAERKLGGTTCNGLEPGAVEIGASAVANPEVISLDPPTAPTGSGNINVNLSGTGFTGTSKVQFQSTGTGVPSLIVNGFTGVNDSSINANIALPIARFSNPGTFSSNATITVTYNANTDVPGTYNVVVTTPAGNSLAVPFTVTGTSKAPFVLNAAPTITTDSGAGTFTVTGGTCKSGFSLSSTTGHTTCTVTVHYVPPTTGSVTSTGHVTLTGTGFANTTINSGTFTGN